MDSTALKLIHPKNGLKNSQTTAQLIAHIVEQLKDISELAKQKGDPEFIKYICNLVENVFVDKKAKVNKKDIVLQIIHKIIPILTEDDKILISNTIEFLHSNKQIKKISQSKIISHKCINFFSFK